MNLSTSAAKRRALNEAAGQIRVLFLSDRNSTRGLMAWGLLRKYGQERFFVNAAGTQPGKVDALAMFVMLEKGVDLTDSTPWDIKRFLGKSHFHHVIVLSGGDPEAQPVFPGALFHHRWLIPDPSTFQGSRNERLEAYREVRDLLDSRITDWLAHVGAPGVAELGKVS